MEKQAEMSLDEVLSSIKQMVVNEEPPVLELTDMVSEDGTIVKVNKMGEAELFPEEPGEMSTFLRMAQENSESMSIPKESESTEVISPVKGEKIVKSEKKDFLKNLLSEIAEPIIRDWVKSNMPQLVRQIVKEELKEVLGK